MKETAPIRLLISAGGTGGHIFPALAVANEFRRKHPDCTILFVGALGKMEMEKIPQAGYEIVGLPVMGMPRKLSLKMFSFIRSLVKSLVMARRVVKEFNPTVAAGFGGFASGPVLFWASRMKVPIVIQEQNSYAGVTNKLLSKRAKTICVAYDGMEKFFPSKKIVFTGNPVRKSLFQKSANYDDALEFFGIGRNKPTVLVLGGSLGARSVNNQVLKDLRWFETNKVQLLWQTGKLYYNEMVEKARGIDQTDIRILQFIDRMDLAYSAADIIISRAGAGTISELCIVGKPVILIPSPNVAEDHQTHNARSLSEKHAAILLPDKKIHDLTSVLDKLLKDNELKSELSENIKKLALAKADEQIANEIFKLV
jgi:UDP-N-acetylglucosamine--N-acetylmuramyl-(pentapeptide) pyrophosphoryl-undecaprenol N-acetylglucosamine transferase